MSGVPSDMTARMVSTLDKVLKENPGADPSYFRLYAVNTRSSGALAFATEDGIAINTANLKHLDKDAADFHVKGGQSVEGVVAHEAGHQLERSITGTSTLYNSTQADFIVRQAESSTGKSRKSLGTYAQRGANEALAEAVADHIVNGTSANSLSNEIYKGLQNRLEVERKNRLNR